MKKFIIAVTCLILFVLVLDAAYYRMGWYVDVSKDTEVSVSAKTRGNEILLKNGDSGDFAPYEIKGVNMGTGKPGEWATSFAVDKRTYLRWFAMIQEMGANTLRVYTIQSDEFYRAFYEYNKNRKEPLYLIQGVWIKDYAQNSHMDAYDRQFLQPFLEDCHKVVDVIHGNKRISAAKAASSGSGTYRRDVSRWVLGYILGVEWEDVTVAYTDALYEDNGDYNSYQGDYMYASADATPFECLLAHVGDDIISYETGRYRQQRLVAFANWCTTDPLAWKGTVKELFMKCACVDVEHIKTTDAFLSGQFASYHVYPYYPDYLNYEPDWAGMHVDKKEFRSADGVLNTYRAYLSLLTAHHSMPVVISEFGVSTGRGMAQRDQNTGRHQGHMSEAAQGDALVSCWEDILSAGCVGGCVFTWQDEWFKRTWNTMYAVDLKRTAYWSDCQTNEQYFGLLSFDPGREQSVCYVDGDASEWTAADIVAETGEAALSVKYDEKYLYFLIHRDGLSFEKDTFYIPLDITPKTGSSYCDNYGLAFDRCADFLLIVHGRADSRLQVQERYESLRANYAKEVYRFDTYAKENIPQADSPRFVNINMILQISKNQEENRVNLAEVFETGLLTYGNANPKSRAFDSLADFCAGGDDIEVRLPWQLLNFADPSRMEIHDDYYDGNYGVEYLSINRMYAGIAHGGSAQGNKAAADRISLEKIKLVGWGNKVTYHERLKSSYYRLQSVWNTDKAQRK